jgi:hypothetical protein
MSSRAAVVHARQDIGWGEFARLVSSARKSAGADGLGAHSLTKWGLRRLQMDLEDLTAAVAAAVPLAEGRDPFDNDPGLSKRDVVRAQRDAEDRHNEGVPGS